MKKSFQFEHNEHYYAIDKSGQKHIVKYCYDEKAFVKHKFIMFGTDTWFHKSDFKKILPEKILFTQNEVK